MKQLKKILKAGFLTRSFIVRIELDVNNNANSGGRIRATITKPLDNNWSKFFSFDNNSNGWQEFNNTLNEFLKLQQELLNKELQNIEAFNLVAESLGFKDV